MIKNTTDNVASTQFRLKIWHPDCWTLQVTEEANARLVIRGMYNIDDIINAQIIAYGTSIAAVDQLVEMIRESPLTTTIQRPTTRMEVPGFVATSGMATHELLVRYPNENSMYDPLIRNEFIPSETIHIYDGKEYWTVVADTDHKEVQRRLDTIRTDMDANITVQRITSSNASKSNSRLASLSKRQHQALRVACRQGYYEWPREVSATDLAAELHIDKSTFLEHLRKAESKILPTDEMTSEE